MSKSTSDEKVQTQENKQLIGSSKRKRKASIIKRNILVDETNDSSKNEKTSGKKIKTEKIKSEKKEIEIVPEPEIEPDQGEPVTLNLENQPEEKKDDEDDEPLGKKQRSNKKPNCTSSSKQECQNCSFCSEHKPGKDSPETNEEDVKKKKFTCETCAKMGIKKIYNSLDKYTDHINLLHEKPKDDIKKFECTDCPEPVWFPTKSKYCYHLGAKHPGIIKFICEVCTETFKLKANYKNHMKTHNIVVQKKFQCDVCMGTFVNRAGYEAHKKRFPGPHIKQNCSHCGFSFSREKHMKNHRCKKLLLEEAARNVQNESGGEILAQGQQVDDVAIEQTGILTVEDNVAKDVASDDLIEKKNEFEKRVVFHRIVPRRNQEQTIYRPVQMQAQNVPESVVVQELREIDIDGNTFIATDSEQQIILRDVNGHIVQGNQILQLDLNDVQPGEESQVYLADWNVVAPFVMREKSP